MRSAPAQVVNGGAPLAAAAARKVQRVGAPLGPRSHPRAKLPSPWVLMSSWRKGWAVPCCPASGE